MFTLFRKIRRSLIDSLSARQGPSAEINGDTRKPASLLGSAVELFFNYL